jgi:hypothetical protein
MYGARAELLPDRGYYRQLGGGLFAKTSFRFVQRWNSPGERFLAPRLLVLVDKVIHS